MASVAKATLLGLEGVFLWQGIWDHYCVEVVDFLSTDVWKTLIAYKRCRADIWLILLVNFGSTTMKYTQNTLDKIERILDELEYVVRYERGNFQSGYCILEARKVVVLNKFLQIGGTYQYPDRS